MPLAKLLARHFEEAVAGALLILLCLATMANVLGRYAFNAPLPWAEELSRYAFIWLVFIGAAGCSKHGRHIAIDVIVQRLPPRLQDWSRLLADTGTLLLMLILFYYGIRLAARAAHPTATLGIPTYYVYMVVPLSALLIILRTFSEFSRNLRAAFGARQP